MKELLISENDAGQRLDKFLLKAVPGLPKGMLCKAVRTRHIKRNGKRCEISDRLVVGDVLNLYLNDSFFQQQRKPPKFLAAPAALSVVYEDAHLLVVHKPVGLVVHTDDGGGSDTLVNRVLRYLYESGAYQPESEQSFTPALCNRLDRNTGGLVIAAKDAETLRQVNEAIKQRQIGKQYLCVTAALPPKEADCCSAYHFRREGERTVQIADKPLPDYVPISTEYQVVAKRNELALLLVTLHTGRTHQIRAHLAHLDAPVLGDSKYGSAAANRRFGERYQLLYAFRLTFPPSLAGGKTVSLALEEIPFLQKYFSSVKTIE